jgi:hypothetical protein
MDLNQTKLTRTEWDSTEISIPDDEKEIMTLIMKGYYDINYIYNKKESLINYLSLVPNENINEHIYREYFKEKFNKLKQKYNYDFGDGLNKIKFQKVNSVEKVKLDNLSSKLKKCEDKIFEYILINMIEGVLKYMDKGNVEKLNKYYYTLNQLSLLKITNCNPKVMKFVNSILTNYKSFINIRKLFMNAPDLIENNKELFDYKDYKLYEHQKQLFQIFKFSKSYLDFKSRPEFKILLNYSYNEDEISQDTYNSIKNTLTNFMKPKLVLYTAPTGTGKTLSPIALAEEYRIIFVCAARHVGLALAKTAISVGKKVAFAFGCHDVKDIRLHYNAAASYYKHEYNYNISKCSCGKYKCQKSGQHIKYKDGKKKIINEDGSNVEIMICDIKSYLCAMSFMCAFNKNKEEIIMYWDEPTITLDYENHGHHSEIQNIWSKNIIPNVVLSSATLPLIDEIPETITDFKSRFPNSQIYSIVSHDCEKSIPILNSENYVELPHLKYEHFIDLKKCVTHCRNYMTILRYFDLTEIVKFITDATVENGIDNLRLSELSIDGRYTDLSNLTINNIKQHYLEVLENILPEHWKNIYSKFNSNKKKIHDSTIYVATTDSHTLKDGPTIFLTEDVNKISKFILQTSKIPQTEMNSILQSIEYNDKIIKTINVKTKEYEDKMGDNLEKDNKMSKCREEFTSPEAAKLKRDIDELSKMVKYVELSEIYIPNKRNHLKRWSNKDTLDKEFSCNINSEDVEEIMLLDGVELSWKLLLLMGIGVFSANVHKDYTELMKTLANQQKLYMIIADSDYIYGTNYQFCHGYLSNSLTNMTQEKTIQAMGRMGRNNKHMSFSVRFRDDKLIDKIFQKEENRIEAKNMNNLFCTELDLSEF